MTLELLEKFSNIFDKVMDDNKSHSVVQWSEQKRVLSSAVSPKYGPVSYDNSPYLKDIVEHFSVTDTTNEIVVMKGAQLGFSQMVLEPIIGFTIDRNPKPVLFLSATQELAEDAGGTRVDGMLESCNLLHKLKPVSNNEKTRATGDTKRKKEFYGGTIWFKSASSPAKLRGISAAVALLDEIDGIKRNIGGNGSPAELAKSRTIAFENTRKIFYGSTPTTVAESNIYPLFLQGDRRRWFVPCPHCDLYQVLTWNNKEVFIEQESGIVSKDKKNSGIRYELDHNGNLIEGSVYYLCENGCKIEEVDKYDMNLKGEWRATTKSYKRSYVSYHLNALASNFSSWGEIVQDFLIAKNSVEKLQVWVNNRMGEPWVEKFKTIDVTKLYKNQKPYAPGIIPNKIAMSEGNSKIVCLIATVDVNGASDRDKGWLAVEIKGFCEGGQSYSIAKAEIHGNTSMDGNCWKALDRIIGESIFESDDGMEYVINLAVVDSGNKTNEVYNFTNNFLNVFAIKGSSSKVSFRFKLSPQERAKLYNLNVNAYKNDLYAYLHLDYLTIQSQPAYYLNFPKDEVKTGLEFLDLEEFGVSIVGGGYNEKYFSTFQSEEKKEEYNPITGDVVKSVWTKTHSTAYNHFWDCNVYSYAALDIYCDILAQNILALKNVSRDSILKQLGSGLEESGEQYAYQFN